MAGNAEAEYYDKCRDSGIAVLIFIFVIAAGSMLLQIWANASIAMGIYDLFAQQANFAAHISSSLVYVAIATSVACIIGAHAHFFMKSFSSSQLSGVSAVVSLLGLGSLERMIYTWGPIIHCIIAISTWAAWALFFKQASISSDGWNNLTGLAVAVTGTLLVDARSLLDMFAWTCPSGKNSKNVMVTLLGLQGWERAASVIIMTMNWMAAHGVACAELKLRMASSQATTRPQTIHDLVTGGFEFIPFVRTQSWESLYSTMCGVYLATIFVLSAANRVGFNPRHLTVQAILYAVICFYLAVVAGLFQAQPISMSTIFAISGAFDVLVLLLWPGPDCRTGRKPAADTDYTKRKDLSTSAIEYAPATGKSYVVIGLGSVGLSIIDTLVARGDKKIKGLDMGPPKRPLPACVEYMKGNITDLASLKRAFAGVDVVFTTAAIIRYYERLQWQYAASHAVNVVGTENIIKACIECNVQMLVQTSSSNVCLAPKTISMNMDETSPYVTAENTVNHYCWTKAQAEQLILQANGSTLRNGGHLRTGALRPNSAIFGPADGFILEQAMNDRYVILLTPDSQIDYVFVENVVWGHILLEKALWSDPKRIGGLAYGASNDEPIVQDDLFVSLAYFYDKVAPRPFKRFYMPRGLFVVLMWVFETYQRVMHRRIQGILCNLTPATLRCASMSYGFSGKRAKDMLGYEPLYNMDESLQKTVAVWHQWKVEGK